MRRTILLAVLLITLGSAVLLMGATAVTDTSSVELYSASGAGNMDHQIAASGLRNRTLHEVRWVTSSTTPPNSLTVTLGSAEQSLDCVLYSNASGTSVTQILKQFDPPHKIGADQTIDLDWTKTAGGAVTPSWQIEVVLTNGW